LITTLIWKLLITQKINNFCCVLTTEWNHQMSISIMFNPFKTISTITLIFKGQLFSPNIFKYIQKFAIFFNMLLLMSKVTLGCAVNSSRYDLWELYIFCLVGFPVAVGNLVVLSLAFSSILSPKQMWYQKENVVPNFLF